MVGIVIVNYNLDDDVLKLVESLIEEGQKNILVVDNYNLQKPDIFNDLAVSYLCTGENLGYGKGNNVGFDYFQAKNINRVLVLNPDVVCLPKPVLSSLESQLDIHLDVAAVSPLVLTLGRDSDDLNTARAQIQVRRILSSFEMFICSTFLRKVFRFVMKRYVYSELKGKGGIHIVDSINGACFLIDLSRINFRFSEEMFLYFEEVYMGYLFKEVGLKFILHGDIFVRHSQGATTGSNNRSYSVLRERQKLSSELLVYTHFKVFNYFTLVIVKYLRLFEIVIRRCLR